MSSSIFFFVVVLVVLSLFFVPQTQSATVIWESYYHPIYNNPTYAKSGPYLEYYQPTTNPLNVTLWFTFLGSDNGIYVAQFSTEDVAGPIRIGTSTSNYRPAIRQLVPYTGSSMLVAWVDSTTLKLVTSQFTPPPPFSSLNATGTYTAPEATENYMNDSNIQLYFYWYSSPSIELFNNNVYFAGAIIATTSTSPPAGPGDVTLMYSTDQGQTLIYGAAAPQNSPSSSPVGPQLMTYMNNLYLQYYYDNSPTKMMVGVTSGSGKITEYLPYANTNGFFQGSGFCFGTNDLPFLSIFVDGVTKQAYGQSNVNYATWVSQGQVNNAVTLSSVYIRSNIDYPYGGFMMFLGNDTKLYSSTFVVQ